MNSPSPFIPAAIARTLVQTLPMGMLALLSAFEFERHADAAAMLGALYEPFDYAAGTSFDAVANLNGGVGWNANGSSEPNLASSIWAGSLNAGANRTATSPGLLYSAIGYLPASGNKLTLDASALNATQNVGRSFGQTIDAGTTYFSILLSKNTPGTIRTFNLAFFNGTTERFAVGQIGAAAGNTAGNIGLLMNNVNPGGLINGTTPIAMGTGIVHLLIGRIDWNAAGNETVSLWVDPTDVTTEAAAGLVYASTSGFDLTAITAVRPFAGNNVTIAGFDATAVSANFDEFRMGSTWEAVTSVVPEPSSSLQILFAISSLGLLRRKHH